MTAMDKYVTDNKEKFIEVVTLPNDRVSLKMTKSGCLFLSSWLRCFTKTFADRRSWNGYFTFNDFQVVNGHVQLISIPTGRLDSSSMNTDLRRLAHYIKQIFCWDDEDLISKYPPYLENLTSFLEKLKCSFLTHDVTLFIETHICCMESIDRGVLLAELQRKYKRLIPSRQRLWDRAILKHGHAPFRTYMDLCEIPVFKDVIRYAQNSMENYGKSKRSTFRLMRDEFVHGPSNRFDKSVQPWKEKYNNDDGIELMIPAYNPDLVPDIIYCLLRSEGVEDISEELHEAQVRCTCRLCHPSSRLGSKGQGGESSKVGKGKHPVLPTQEATIPEVSHPASPGISRRSYLDAAKSSPVRQSSSSSRFSPPSSQDAKVRGKGKM